ncbi:phosphoglucosamine mutase [Clostridiaceae bacterium M8S5]|nr:phosphoglucosamine mutase [Clostridiaceae bacterium M8S5]
MGKLFGTDGVRGIANTELTVELVYKLGRIGAYILTKGKKCSKIIVGMDTRKSKDMLGAALMAGICSVGVDVINVGVVPTPAVSYLTKKYKADAGVVISASHNPVDYNGIKFFNSEGYKLNDNIENEIEKYIFETIDIEYNPVGEDIGKIIIDDKAINDYQNFLKGLVDVDFAGLKIAIDCANGASYKVAPDLLRELGAEVEVYHNNPDGTNINLGCGSTHPDVVKQIVLEKGCDIGLAFDGDADRLIAVDEKGNIVDGDYILAICSTHLKEKGQLTNNTVVGTIMANMGLDKYCESKGIKVEKTKVGDRYVLEEMIAGDYVLGGEQSGHIIFLEHNTTGDGLLTALQLISVMKNKNKKLSELAGVMKRYPQVLVNALVSNKNKANYLSDDIIKTEIQKIEEEFHGEGRVVIRPSGTEPKIRVMIEGKDENKIAEKANYLAELIKQRLA